MTTLTEAEHPLQVVVGVLLDVVVATEIDEYGEYRRLIRLRNRRD